jgi:tetratricopeptide (TPR) repeat protein
MCGVAMVYVLVLPAWGQSPATLDCETIAACVALVEQAHQQSKAGQLAEAEKSYKLAYEESHDARLLFNIARVLDKLGNGPEATSYYRQFIQASVAEETQKKKARKYVAQLEAMLAPQRLSPFIPAADVSTPTPLVTSTAERKSTPFYRTNWFWGVVGGLIPAAGLGIGLGVVRSNR